LPVPWIQLDEAAFQYPPAASACGRSGFENEVRPSSPSDSQSTLPDAAVKSRDAAPAAGK
jgi:hypothetical protein